MPFAFFHRQKPRGFNYQPIYYDQEKEELEERLKEIEALKSGDPHAKLKAQFRRKWHRGGRQVDRRYNMIKYAIFFIVFAMAIYLLFFTDFLTNLFTIFLGNK
jgi:hypothetical protein